MAAIKDKGAMEMEHSEREMLMPEGKPYGALLESLLTSII